MNAKEHRDHFLVFRTDPVYPQGAAAARSEGPVVLDAIIGMDGEVQELRVVTGDPLLTGAAMEAVRQWVYRPVKLNGRPVEVSTQIEVPFRLPS